MFKFKETERKYLLRKSVGVVGWSGIGLVESLDSNVSVCGIGGESRIGLLSLTRRI